MTLREFNIKHGCDYHTLYNEDYEIFWLDVDVDKTSAWTIVQMIEEGVKLKRNWIEDAEGHTREIFQIG